MATDTILSEIKLVRAGRVNSKNIVLSLLLFYCPTGKSIYKDNFSSVRHLRKQIHREFQGKHFYFDSSWLKCGSDLEVRWLKQPPTSL